MVYTRLGIREIRQRPGRAILTLLSIVIGVAAVIAVSLASDTTGRAFDAIYETVAGKAAFEITAPFGTTFDAKIADEVGKVSGVADVSPVIERTSVMYVGDKRIQFMLMGVEPERDLKVHAYRILEGKKLGDGPGVIVDASFAKSAGIKLDDRIEIVTPRGTVRALVSGLFQRDGVSATGQGASLLMSLKSAQILYKVPGKIDNAQIVLAPDANEAQAETAIAKLLPSGLTVGHPASRSAMADETSLSTKVGMELARGFSLIVAIFIIAITFLINVSQRRKQIGILRAIGATRLQIGIMIYSEAILMGIVGSVLGFIVGVAGARVLSRAMGELYQTSLPAVSLTPKPFILAGVIGLGVTFLGAALPARRARQLSPMDALRDVLPAEIEGFSRWLTIVGAALAGTGGGMLTLAILGHVQSMHAVWSAIILLIGLALLSHLVLRPFSAVAAAIIAPFMRIESRLARREILRHYSRTTLTCGAVFIAIACGIGLANAVLDNVNNVRDWYQTAFSADFIVRATAPAMSTGLAADLPDDLGSELRGIGGIESMDALRLVRSNVGDEPTIVAARDFSPRSIDTFVFMDGNPKTILTQLQAGEVIVSSVLAQRAHLKVGGKVSLGVGKAARDFSVAAMVNDYQAGGLILYMDRGVAHREFGIQGVDAYLLRVDHQQLAPIRAELDKLASKYGLLLVTPTDMQQKIDGMMSGVVAALWGMVVILLLVAAFGVANTLTMNVLEQTWELGLLRIIAMTRDQVRKTVFSQALMIGFLSLVPGIIAGFGIAYLINLATLPVTGHPVELEFHPWLLAGAFGLGMLVITAAAWLPAERAARLSLAEALHYD